MFEALKRVYVFSTCIVRFIGKISESFETFSGIKQGAASSVILFIMFMDDIIDYLQERCVREPLLRDLHCLIHADDTVILSTTRELFIHKCEQTFQYFSDNKLTLNMNKSAYMIINAFGAPKRDLLIGDKCLKYQARQTYLGAIITDIGNLSHDNMQHSKSKQPSVSVKLTNFIRNSKYCSVWIKLKVLTACVNSSLLY